MKGNMKLISMGMFWTSLIRWTRWSMRNRGVNVLGGIIGLSLRVVSEQEGLTRGSGRLRQFNSCREC